MTSVLPVTTSIKMISEEDLTLDNIGRAGFVLYQQKKGFRLGTDSVLLAWFAASFARKDRDGNYRKTSFLELGSGCGGASVCVAARLPDSVIDCCEIMTSSCEVLQRNLEANNLTDRVSAYNCDIRQFPDEVRQKQYDIVFSNPPFFNGDRGNKTDPEASSDERLAARFEENGTIEDFIKASKSRVIPSTGHIIMVMKADRLTEIMSLMDTYNIRPVRLMSIHPLADRNASSVLIAGKVGGTNSQLRILPPLILNETSDGSLRQTMRITEIYEGEHKDCFI